MSFRNENILTRKETEVLELLKKPKTRKAICRELSISINTVNSHIRNLHLKTKTHTLAELVLWKPDL